jgi:acyl-CoA synthetase (AMP-forming)/AMP-acid ligase II
MKTWATDAAASTLVELLQRRAAQQSDQRAYAFLSDGEMTEISLTYQQLDRQARGIGALLQQANATGARALLLYPPGLDYIAAFFGCLYAGVVAVPAYPPHPSQLDRALPRLRAIMKDAQPILALTTSSIRAIAEAVLAHPSEQPAESPLQSLRWLATDMIADHVAEEWRPPALRGDTLAFFQYTSGSTAEPRGVMLTHANLLHNSAQIQRYFAHTPDSRGVIWLPPYHDMGLIGGIIQPLYAGFPVVLMSPTDFLQRPFRWLQAIARYQATTSGGPNFAYDLCVRKITPEQRATLDLSSWEVAFSGAEPIRAESLDRFVEAFAPYGFRRAAFYPCYGLAEATLIVSGSAKSGPPLIRAFQKAALEHGRAIAAEHADARILVGCGCALPDQQILIVHPTSLTQCETGAVGEIWVAGPSIAQGYWQQPDATRRTFHAYLADSDAGPFLRTGDLGFIQDGELFITGRLKDLIIIRGRNHYPQDIERTVERSHSALRPGCGAAFAVEIDGDERLVVVHEIERNTRHENLAAVAETVRRAVAEQHELHLHALALIKTQSIPKTSSGKIQRHACRAAFLAGGLELVYSDIQATASESSDEAAAGQALLTIDALLALDAAACRPALEAFLQRQTARVLRCAPARIDPCQPLSGMGLDSLMVIELKNTIETGLSIAVSATDLLAGASITDLATGLLAQIQAGGAASPRHIERVPRSERLPLSFAQERFWFLNQLDPGNPSYHCPATMRMVGPLHIAALERTLSEIVRRHEILRTTVKAEADQLTQVIGLAQPQYLPVIDLRTLSELAREATAQRLAVAEAQRPFDLAHGPLLRATLLRLADEQHILLITMHHIASDAWSVSIINQEITALYTAFAGGAPSPLPALPIQYADFAAWQRQRLQGAVLDELLDYWTRRLSGDLPILDLVADRQRPAVRSYRGMNRTFQLPATTRATLKALSRQEGCTLFMVLLAAFQTLLYWYTDQEDMIVGTAIAGRNFPGTEALIGCFLNLLVLRTDLSGNPTFQEALRRVREVTLAAYDHQDLPFEKLVAELRAERSLSHTPLFQVAFGVQNTPRQTLELPEIVLSPLTLDYNLARYDLTLWMWEEADSLVASWTYSLDLVDESAVARLHHDFEVLLHLICVRPDARLRTLAVLADLEKQPRGMHTRVQEEADPRRFVPGKRRAVRLAHALAPPQTPEKGNKRQ